MDLIGESKNENDSIEDETSEPLSIQEIVKEQPSTSDTMGDEIDTEEN